MNRIAVFFAAVFVVVFMPIASIAGAPFVRTGGDPQIEGNTTFYGDTTFNGAMEAMLGSTESLVLDAATIVHTSVDGVLQINWAGSGAGAKVLAVNAQPTADISFTGIESEITGRAAGSSGSMSSYHATMVGDDNDASAVYVGFGANDFAANGGTNAAFGLGIGLNYTAALSISSGDVWFHDYAATIMPLRLTAGAGDNLTIHAGDGLDAGAGARDGGDLRLHGGLKANAGTDGDTLLAWNGAAAQGNAGIGTGTPSSILHIKANSPGVVGNNQAGQLIIQDPDNDVNGNAVITGYESDVSGNPDQQLWYLGSSAFDNEDILFSNRRNASLNLGTSNTIRMTIDANGQVFINGGVSIDNPGATQDSYKLSLVADDGGVVQTGALYTVQGGDPYIRISAPNDAGTETATIDVHDTLIVPSTPGGVSLGSSGNWFNQVYQIYATLQDQTNPSHGLSLKWDEDGGADYHLGFKVNGASRTVDLSGNLTVEAASIVNQDLSTDASVQFGDVTAGTGITSTAGNITASAGSCVDQFGDVRMARPIVDADVPAEPFTCNAAVYAWIIPVDDTDDTSASWLCWCARTDDVGGYAWRKVSDEGSCF